MAYQAITSFKTAALFALALSVHASTALTSVNALDTNTIANPATIEIRAQPNAPDGYSPADEDCPSARPVIRTASKLSPNETSWLEQRRGKTVGPMRDLLGRINITGFDAAAYISDHAQNISALPNIAIAVSGGGYRALLNGAGALQAFDSREQNSTVAGHLGGLLQSSTYLAGLSGGGWLVGSIFVNNYTTISNLLRRPAKTSSVWEFGNSIFKGPPNNGSSLLSISRYFDDIYQAVTDKAKAGFQTSITDYWGRALSYQLINATDGGPSYTWSSIATEQQFATGDTPLPLLVADGRAPGETVISTNSTVFEFSPWEMGTFDPTIFGFAPLEFLGSNFSNGALPSERKCVRGFDNAGYIMGTSSSLFNAFLLSIDSSASPDIPDIAKKFVTRILQTLNQTNNDIADYSPNPFYGYHNATNLGSQSERLTLVDGGEDLQNIPLHPLIQPTRFVDVIFAVDSSADTNSFWPNGTSLVATYERSRNKVSNGTSFPAVPDTNTFVNLGLNARPTFFGCNSSNTTGPTPLVVYIPNAPYVYLSNVSTFDPAYNNSERDAIVANGYAVATLGNGTVDSQWPACVGCAILSRSLGRTKTSVPEVCQQCFKRYCWDGTVNSTSPAPYQPKVALTAINVKSSDASERIQMSLLSGIGLTMLTIAILGL